MAERGVASSGPPPRLKQDLDPTDKIFGLRQVLHYAGFAARAVRRRYLVALCAFVLTFATVVAATLLAPKTYEIEVKLLAQRSDIIASLSNPGRPIPFDVDAPTRAAAETILRRDNVIALIRETDLINAWDRTRAPLLRTFDQVKAKLRGHEPTLDEKLDALIEEIEARLFVATETDRDGVVTIYLRWPDPASGYQLVERAQHSFLQARRLAETQAIAEALTVLERYTGNLRKDIQVTLAELMRTRARVLAELGPTRPRVRQPTSIVATILDTPSPLEQATATFDDSVTDANVFSDPRIGRLKKAIVTKRGELARLEEEQKRHLADLQAQLSVARTIYTPNHPTVQSLQQNVSAFQNNSPQIRLLRRELDRLEEDSDHLTAAAAERLIRAELGRRGGVSPAPRAAVVRRAPMTMVPAEPEEPIEELVTGTPRPTAVADFATLRLRTELNQLHGILERSDSARIELAVSQAAFKHRYAIISPASEPSAPMFPKARAVILAGFLASLLFALLAAIGADIMSNRILESWQVQRQLGLPVLGAVRLS